MPKQIKKIENIDFTKAFVVPQIAGSAIYERASRYLVLWSDLSFSSLNGRDLTGNSTFNAYSSTGNPSVGPVSDTTGINPFHNESTGQLDRDWETQI